MHIRYVAVGDYSQGAFVNLDLIGSKWAVDWTDPNTPRVVDFIHGPNGELVLQTGERDDA